MESIKIASVLNLMKKDAVSKRNELKSINYKTVINTLESVGVKIEKTEWESFVETGKGSGRNPFNRTSKKGVRYSFTLNENKFVGETTDKNFSFNLTGFITTISPIECAKSLK